jgi:hypothetical protein
MGRSHRYRAALLSANKAGAYTAMPIFAYFVVAGSVMIALLFFMGAPPEKGTRRAMVISDVESLPMPWRPDRKQVLSDAVPAPAPDMTSPLVLAAQPKDQSPSEALAKSAVTDQKQMAARHSREALAARAEASPPKKRVTRLQPPVEYRQNNAPPQGREFGLSGTN